jgi:hypothetical protein
LIVEMTTDGGTCRQENRMYRSAVRPNAEWLRPSLFRPKQRAERLKTAAQTPRHPRSAEVSSRRKDQPTQGAIPGYGLQMTQRGAPFLG